jgi:hypothetical protein
MKTQTNPPGFNIMRGSWSILFFTHEWNRNAMPCVPCAAAARQGAAEAQVHQGG